MATTENARPTTGMPARKSLIEVLVAQGALTPQQVAIAVAKQKESGDTRQSAMGPLLLRLGFVVEEDLTRAQAQLMGVAYASPDQYEASSILPEALAAIPASMAHQHGVLPIGRSKDGKSLRVVSASQWTQPAYATMQTLAADLNLSVEPLLGTEKLVRAAVRAAYGEPTGSFAAGGNAPTAPNAAPQTGAAPPAPANGAKNTRHAVPALVEPTVMQRAQSGAHRASDVLSVANSTPVILAPGANMNDQVSEGDIDTQEFSVDQPIIIQFVNKIIADAISHRASDIHFEPRRDRLEIKYRVDGSLHTVDEVPKSFQSACVSRIKVMSEMNIAERRVPQDGRISVRISGRTVDMRVSSLPTQYGEAVVMRILDRSSMTLDINVLGFEERNLATLKSMITKPHGIFLATGPTGSGKTTTLYAAIQAIKAPDINIITCEDPIEYDLDGIRQSSVNEKAGLTFAKQLRSILRQDPDVIYVGEIRDAETAEIAFRAALTGHLVFSTLHCNDAAGAVTRLLNMGIDPFLIASTVLGAMAQRLVRRVCPECACRYEPSNAELMALGLDPKSEEVRNAQFIKGAGCPNCDKTGYRGRCSVQELMVMDDTVRNMTLERAPSNKIRIAAINTSSNAMIPMRRDGAIKVMKGMTTSDEVQRRVFISDED